MSWLAYSRYDSVEDRWLKLAFKLSLLVTVVAVEVVFVTTIALLMWQTVR